MMIVYYTAIFHIFIHIYCNYCHFPLSTRDKIEMMIVGAPRIFLVSGRGWNHQSTRLPKVYIKNFPVEWEEDKHDGVDSVANIRPHLGWSMWWNTSKWPFQQGK